MAYTPKEWQCDELITANDLNRMEQGIAQAYNDIILSLYPVGSIVFNTDGANPSTYIGGTWEAWGSGRVPVGVDTTQEEFNTAEKNGGAKAVTLTTAQMPQHNHDYVRYSEDGFISPTTGGNVYVASKASSQGLSDTSNEGGGQAHNNLQPYVTCYMWKRTA